MKLFIILFATVFIFTFNVCAYLGEKYAPFSVSLTKDTGTTSDPIVLKQGDSIRISW